MGEQAGEQKHVGQATSSAPAASSARRPGGELHTGCILLLGCGAPVAGCSPTARGVTTTTLNGVDADAGGPSTDGSTTMLPDTSIVTIGAEVGGHRYISNDMY